MNRSRAARPRARRAPGGVLLALCSAALAVAAHGLAGGDVADTALVVPLTSVLAWAGNAVAQRALPLFAVLAGTQLAQHLLLVDLAAHHDAHQAAAGGWAMLAWHAIATLVTAVLLTRAKATFAVVAAAARRLVAAVVVSLPDPQPRSSSLPVVEDVHGALGVLLTRVCRRRGPPVLS